jgi:hypothetical protein
MLVAIFTGADSWADEPAIDKALMRLPQDTIILHGAGDGLDAVVDMLARQRGFSIVPLPADAERYGELAKVRRDIEMLNLARILESHGYEIMVYTFGGMDMPKLAREQGVQVVDYGKERDSEVSQWQV